MEHYPVKFWPFKDPAKWTTSEKVYGRFAGIIAIFVVQWCSLIGSIFNDVTNHGWLNFGVIVKIAILAFFVFITYQFHKLLRIAIRIEAENERKKKLERERNQCHEQ